MLGEDLMLEEGLMLDYGPDAGEALMLEEGLMLDYGPDAGGGPDAGLWA